MIEELPQEFWEKLETESKIGTPGSLPYIHIVEGSLVTTRIIKSDGSCGCLQSLRMAPESALTEGLGIKKSPALILTSIYLPESLQRRGIGSRVIETLEKRAKREGKLLGIDTIASEAMGNLCKKMKFIGCAPCSGYKIV